MNQETSEIDKKIAQLLGSLPSSGLQQQVKTPAQIEEWEKARKNYRLLAECWISKYLEKEDYPIDEALDRQEICPRKAELINNYVNECKAKWKLCQVAENSVKRLHTNLQNWTAYVEHFPKPVRHLWQKFFKHVSLKEYPFQSAYDLFAETLREEADDAFGVCLQPYYEVPMKKWRTVAKQYTKFLERAEPNGIYPQLSNREQRTLKGNLVWNKVGFSWIGMVLWACQIEAKNNPLLREQLVDYNRALWESLSVAVTASYRMGGWAWQKGKLLNTGSGGVYLIKP